MNRQNNKAALLRQIQEAGFTLHELVLFLDTHPTDRQALAMYRTYQKKYAELIAQYEAEHGPLTAYGVNGQAQNWTWGKDGWPWQNGCGKGENNHVDV